MISYGNLSVYCNNAQYILCVWHNIFANYSSTCSLNNDIVIYYADKDRAQETPEGDEKEPGSEWATPDGGDFGKREDEFSGENTDSEVPDAGVQDEIQNDIEEYSTTRMDAEVS